MNKLLKKVTTMNTLFKRLKSNKGNSLAEFAVTAAMMATLATTAAPRFAGVGETGKQNQTMANLDKIGQMANQFYMDKSSPATANNPMGESQGRIPGQERYDTKIGGYDKLTDLETIMNETFDKWDDAEGANWRSVFGTARANPSYSSEYNFTDDDGGKLGPTEWDAYMSQEEGPIVSPYQQGHYIYIVIPGGQREFQNPESGAWTLLPCNECGPIMVIADAYNPSKFWTVKSFN
jgi:hypothetical protein